MDLKLLAQMPWKLFNREEKQFTVMGLTFAGNFLYKLHDVD